MSKFVWMIIVALGLVGAFGAGGVGEAQAATGAGDGGTCTCSANWMFGGCQIAGPCPCTCYCRPWGRCRCECTGAAIENPVGD